MKEIVAHAGEAQDSEADVADRFFARIACGAKFELALSWLHGLSARAGACEMESTFLPCFCVFFLCLQQDCTTF